MRLWLWAPLAVFVLFVGVVASGLFAPGERAVRSAMIDKALPGFSLPAATATHPALRREDFAGTPRLLNIFASWCVPCIAEAPMLAELNRQGVVIEGVAVRDTPAAVTRFLRENGDPYRAIGSDVASSVQLAIGSSGVPETFVVDGRGVIRYQHIGAVTAGDVPVLIAKLDEAR